MSGPSQEFADGGGVGRLDESRAERVEAEVASLFARGQHDQGLELIRVHADEFPRRDHARALLMEGLARTGRQVEALRAYEDYRTFLAEDAGAVPSQQLQDLSNEIAIGEMATTPGVGDDSAIIDLTDDSTDVANVQDLVAYLVTDLVGSTRIRVELGDRRATPLMAEADDVQRSCVAQFGGSIAQGTGDGITAWFTSVTDAIEAMLEIGRRIGELGDDDVSLTLRAVVDAGDVDWDGPRPTGPMAERANDAVDAFSGEGLTCSELASVLVAVGQFSFEPGPLPGLLTPRRLVEPAR